MEKLMKYFFRATSHQANRFRRGTHLSTIQWRWQIVGIVVFIHLGLASEGLACHLTPVSPASLTFNAVQGAANPPNQTVTLSRTGTGTVTLNASDNASWVSESPATTSMSKSATFTVAVNTSGRTAGTYNATVTIKSATWCTKTVPVALIVSPAGGGGGGGTSSATLRWNAVTGTTVSGYKVYVGQAPNQYTRTINVGNLTSSTVNSLTVGRTYYFVVTAYNSAGESPSSNMVSKTIQ